MACCKTSIGPLNAVALSCNLILTSSNGVTTKLSVPPAAHPVRIAMACVVSLWPLLVINPDHHPFALTCGQRPGPSLRASTNEKQYDHEEEKLTFDGAFRSFHE